MPSTKRATVFFLCASILHLVALTGCASSGAPIGSAGKGMANPKAEAAVDAAYLERLRQKPPEELTQKEIAYLQMAAERQQAGSLKVLTGLTVVGFSVTLLGAVVALVVAGGAD